MKTNPLYERTLETSLLVDFLLEHQHDDLISYQAMNAHIRGDVTAQDRGRLHSARKILMKEHGLVFGTVNTKGVKLLNDHERVDEAETALARMSGIARRAKSKLATVNYAALDDHDKLRHQTKMATFFAAHEMARKTAQQRLADGIRVRGNQLPPSRETLALLAG